jgi:serine/threonine protein kinase
VLSTGPQKELETTVPFGSSAMRAALDAALAAGPQAVAAEVARLRKDAASGSSAAIKILEESGDDLAQRMATPGDTPAAPDVAGLAQDAMRIAAVAAMPADPRQIGANVPLDPRYAHPDPAAVQHDPTMYGGPQTGAMPQPYGRPTNATPEQFEGPPTDAMQPRFGPPTSAMPQQPAGGAFAVDGELRTLPHDLYQLGGELARGGMGRILRARDVRLGRPVAIKELLGNDPAMQARFEREALITARLQHPAIVPIYEAGRWPTGELFFAMKLVAGKPLDQLIASADTMRQRLALLPNVIAMAEALAYAHSNNVVHRDLKPANVLVGDFGETIVIDWGLAKDLLDSSGAAEPAGPFRAAPARPGATVAGSVMGTPAYMPPEQGKGLQVDARADVYAIGALLYHVLAKRPPYDGPDGMTVLQAMLAAPPPPLAEIQPDVPPELATIVAKAMARDPLERYPTARELASDLRRFQNGQMVGVHRYSTRDLFRRWVKKHRGALSVAAAACVLLVGIGIFAITRILDANKVAQQQRDEALAQHQAAVAAATRAEQSETRAKASERTVIIERDRQRFVRERRIEMDHFKHTQVAKCQQCHLVDPKTFTAKAGTPGHAECVSCHEADKMEGLRDDPKCAYCHLDRKPTTKDQSSLRACDDAALTALNAASKGNAASRGNAAGGKQTPCFRHDTKAHRFDDKGQPLECTTCHGVLADKSKWGARTFSSLDDLDRHTIIGQGPAGGVDAMHHACTTGCHHHGKQVDPKDPAHNCSNCHPARDK